ncbi:glycosyltransferase family 2 protein [Spiribacter sp. 218]|uniref:glycosyltransferase family 2 protein n=1 Tax=Spiribacter pallidus TaxID=1987936 RepID=UPI00349FB0E4
MSTPAAEIRITVGIACYNAADTVDRAIDSVCRQDWPELEILVADDASTDGTAERVAARARQDARIRLVRRDTNGGAGATRQTILEAATGEFLAFFDDDDVSDPRRLRCQLERLRQWEHDTGIRYAACYASGRREYPNGHVIELPAIGSRPVVPAGPAVADYLLFGRRRNGWYYGAGTPTCALMARREVLLQAGGFDPSLRRVEDADLAVRMALAGAAFPGCPEGLFLQYATFAGDKDAESNYRAELALLDKHRDYLERLRRYDYARRWFTVRYHHLRRDWPNLARSLAGAWLRHPLWTTAQALRAGPRRLLHERRAGLRPLGRRA